MGEDVGKLPTFRFNPAALRGFGILTERLDHRDETDRAAAQQADGDDDRFRDAVSKAQERARSSRIVAFLSARDALGPHAYGALPRARRAAYWRW